MARVLELTLAVALACLLSTCGGDRKSRSRTSANEMRKRAVCMEALAAKQRKKNHLPGTRTRYRSNSRHPNSTRHASGRKRVIALGMSKRNVERMCGEPDNTGYVKTPKGIRERWVYRLKWRGRQNRLYLYFRKEVLIENYILEVVKKKRRRPPPKRVKRGEYARKSTKKGRRVRTMRHDNN